MSQPPVPAKLRRPPLVQTPVQAPAQAPVHGLARKVLSVVVAAAALTTAAQSRAECNDAARLGTCIDADTLWPHPGPGRFQSVGATETTAPTEFSLGLVTTYLRKPIVLRAASADPKGTEVPAIEDMVDTSFLWGLGLAENLELTLAMPVTLYQDGTGISPFTSSGPVDMPGSSIRDFRFGVTYGIVPRARRHPGNAFSLTGRFEVGAPTGDEGWFGGDRGAVLVPTISMDFRHGSLFAGGEVGARVRRVTNLAGARVGSQGLVALGLGYDVLADELLSAAIEAYALPTFSQQEDLARDPDTQEIVEETSSRTLIPAEWMATFRSAPTSDGDLSFSLSGGSALPLSDSAVTTPQVRFTLGVRFAPLSRDSDGDGVLDRNDQCPMQVEDRDGFEDLDGCVDADNDRDAVPDSVDRCRDKAEDKDGFQDEDGCPELDDDGDGIADVDDTCRFKPEDEDGFEDEDGCPDEDNDMDGIPDTSDRCPDAAEDRDGYNDADGCPDPDNDVDGILDAQDRCPLSREDKDGFEDDDGCPDLDNDADGVPDTKDRCPTAAETINGADDADGCPEPGAKDLTVLRGATVSVIHPRRFLPGSARVQPALRAQLLMMAQRALGVQPLQRIIVQTYADHPGASARNEELAAERADAIRAVLLEAGLPAKYLIAAAGDLTTKRKPGSAQFEITVQRGKIE